MTDKLEYSGLVVLVTGGGSGIGAACADRLEALGARVAILDRVVSERANRLSVSVDVTDESAVVAAVARIEGEYGGIDVVVNCAGIGAAGCILDNDNAEWRRVFEVNVIGAVNVIRACIPYLIASSAGSVVNVASAVALTGFPDRVLYTASKGAVLAMTRALAADHLKDGVRFNAVCPGTTETPWVGRLLDAADDPAAERRALEARQPHGRLITAEEIAGAVAYLASPWSGSTNGVALSVDAGIEALYVVA
ncbi:MAG: SDR family oxidoreductase [Microbacteriaceae bacterium]|nr:MAG: SDR family oxidoreductase [Microbacteriaceae bacterium]